LGKKTIIVAGVLLAVFLVASFAYQGPGIGILFGSRHATQTSADPGCRMGPYVFSDIRLNTTSLVATVTNNGTASVNSGIFDVSLGVSKPNVINLTAPSSVSFFPQSIGVKQSSTLEFDLQRRWILGAGAYNVTLGTVSDNGIRYSCNMILISSAETQVEIVNASLRFDKKDSSGSKRTASVEFTVRNNSDGLFTGGSVCYVGQSDCSGNSSVRFNPVPAHSSAVERTRFGLSGIDPKGPLLFSLVLDVGVVYLFPVRVSG
jgi:hypothetical protein